MKAASKNSGATGRQNWATPPWFFDLLDQWFGPFKIDVCAEPWSAKCDRYFTKEQDGIAHPWDEKFFCNPPFVNSGEFIEKGYRDIVDGVSPGGLYLLPANTDTGWFHDYAALGEIILVRGRINFDLPPRHRDRRREKPRQQSGNPPRKLRPTDHKRTPRPAIWPIENIQLVADGNPASQPSGKTKESVLSFSIERIHMRDCPQCRNGKWKGQCTYCNRNGRVSVRRFSLHVAGKRARERRVDRNESLREAAERLGMTPVELGLIERGMQEIEE